MIASASTSRPLRMRKRRDVTAHPLQYGIRRYWGIKDPISLRYFQLREEEYAIFRMLDRPVSLDEIREQFERDFAPQRLSLHELQSFLAMLHGEGLIVSDAPGQDAELFEQAHKRRRREFLQKFTNPLAIRFRGLDPDRFLNWLTPQTAWLFTRTCFVLAALLMLSAATLIAVNFHEAAARMPEFDAFFGWRNGLLLLLIVAVTKILHELGHGVACKRFGGECHELGFMLLVMTPCLYVNVSDAWMLPNKWARIAISGAGMYVELILASLCTFLWWHSEPGLLNAVCLNVMFVSSVSTIMFNGNPLLRYDGYYMLADLVEVPNLRQQSGALVKNVLGQFFMDKKFTNERMLPHRGRVWLFLYNVAAVVYRFVVVIAILWVVHAALKPYRLEVLAQMLAVVTVAGMTVGPVISGVKFLFDPLRTQGVDWGRLFARGGILLMIALVIGFIPLPHRINVPVVIQPQDAERVYVSYEGRLRADVEVQPGDEVTAGQTIATLENLDLAQRVAEQEGELKLKELELLHLKRRRLIDPAADEQISSSEKSVEKLRSELAELKKDVAELELKAPIAGTVLPPESRQQKTSAGVLREWKGEPLDPKNRGCWLSTGTTVCLIGDPQRLEAELIIDQADIEFIKPKQDVKIALDEWPGVFLRGTIIEIAEIDLKIAPRQLVMHEDLPSRLDAEGNPQLVSTSYRARVKLDDYNQKPLLRTTGRAKVSVESQSLFARLFRYLNRTFRL